MLLLTDMLIILCLVFIVIQDVKHREISWIWIPLILAGFIYKGVVAGNVPVKEMLMNLAFVSVQLLGLSLYIGIKDKKLVNIINTYLGLGDVLFFVVICTAFSPLNFIAFYLLSMIVTLIGVVIFNRFSENKAKDIPLAGAMAAALIILIITNKIMPEFDFYNDGYLLSIINL